MSTTITIITGVYNQEKGFKEETWIVPKNVADESYFQLAVQYNVYHLFDGKLQADIAELQHKISCYNEKEALEVELKKADEKTLNEHKEIAESLSFLYEEFVNNNNMFVDEFKNDMYALMYASVKTNIKGFKEKTFDKNGNVSFKVVHPLPIYSKWTTAITDVTNNLAKVFNLDEPLKKEEKNIIFDSVRSIMNDRIKNCISERYKNRYKNINCNKVGVKYISRYYSATAQYRNGKNGGVKYTTKKSEQLLNQLFFTIFDYMGCEEPVIKKNTATNANELASAELKNKIKAEKQETSK